MAQYLLFLLARRLLARVPRRALGALGVTAGAVAYIVARRAREAIQRNLAVGLPDASDDERRRLALRAFIHAAWSYIELLTLKPELSSPRSRESGTYPPPPPSTVPSPTPNPQTPTPSDIHIEGWEHVERALVRGKGVIMVGVHVGPLALGGQAVCARGIPTTLVVEQLQPPAFHRLTVDLRAQTGLRQIPLGPAALRGMVEALRRNEIVGIVVDRDVAGSGELLPFFGRTTRMTTAAAAIALRTGAAVLPALVYRTGPFTAVGQIQAEVEIPKTGDAAADVREGTLRILQRMEAFIRQHPDQWVVFSDIWPHPDVVKTDRA
jgi:KDO2-lipid IV(A) lauroyltransferase